MTPEEYQRIKEAEKEHLRALKKLKEKLREVERQKSIARALEKIYKAPGDDILRTHEEMIDRLAMDTVRQEARLEMALSEADLAAPTTDDDAAQKAATDAEFQRLRAQELVRQIKVQMGIPEVRRKNKAEPAHTPDEPASVDTDDQEDDVNPTGPGSLPDKTIGRIRRKKT